MSVCRQIAPVLPRFSLRWVMKVRSNSRCISSNGFADKTEKNAVKSYKDQTKIKTTAIIYLFLFF